MDNKTVTHSLSRERLKEMRKVAGASHATIRTLISGGATSSNDTLPPKAMYTLPSVTTSSNTNVTYTITTTQANCTTTSSYTVVAAASSYRSPTTSLGTPTISESAPPIAQTAYVTNKCSFQSVIPEGRKRKGNTITFQKDQKAKKQASQLQKMPSNVETPSLSSISNNRFAAFAEEADRIMQVDLPESFSDEETTPAADNGSRQSSNTVKLPAICVQNINNPHAMELALNSCAGESNYTL